MQFWKCKECGNDFTRYDTIRNLCGICLVSKTKQKPLFKIQKPIKAKSTKNKNTIAKFTTETKKIIKARDISCINCGNAGTDYHHAYFGGQAERGPDRNNPEKGVLLCEKCHYEIHHGTSGLGKVIRARCIIYLSGFRKKV